jgi:transcriptional regulator with XRE-family HTH domain
MKKPKPALKLPELEAISARLREIRKEKGYGNYEHIAFDLGMSRSAYWRLENGENYSLKTLIKVCKVLGVTLEEFFQGLDCPKPEKRKKK